MRRSLRVVLPLIVIALASGSATFALAQSAAPDQEVGVKASSCPQAAKAAAALGQNVERFVPDCPSAVAVQATVERAAVVELSELREPCAALRDQGLEHGLCDASLGDGR